MPLFDMTSEGTLPDFASLVRAFPELSARVLGYLGKEAALELAAMMQQGQSGIVFRSMDSNRRNVGGNVRYKKGGGRYLSRGGWRMISYSVGKNAKWVRISSFPLNLYEGKKRIIRGTLRGVMSGRLEGAAQAARDLIMDDWYNKNVKGAAKTF